MRERGAGKDSPTAMRQSTYYRQTIENIKNETKKLKEQMGADQFQATAGSESQIARLQDQGDAYMRKIEQEKKKVAELDRQIAEMQEKIKKQREDMGGIQGAKETNESINRKIRGLENKLDKALQKYNESVAQNKQLRDQIDTLRREKVVYNNIYNKLKEELDQKREEMRQIVERGQQAIKERDDAKNRMLELRQEAEREQEEFQKEWQELNSIIEKDKKVKDLLQSRDDVQAKNHAEDASENAEIDQEKDLYQKISSNSWGVIRDKASIRVSVKKVEQYDEAFKKIQEATGISDIDELVKTFVDAEKHNYSLYNYVNELTNDIERLEKQIAEIKQEIERYKGQGLQTDHLRRKKMEELEGRIHNTELRAEDYERKYDRTMKTINALKVGIQSIFEKIGCNNEDTQQMFQSQGVNESNMMQYLGVIEQRTNEILQMYAACQPGQGADNNLQANSNQQRKTKQLVKIEIDAPQFNVNEKEVHEEEDANQPLSKNEMRDRAMKKILASRKK